MTTKRKTHLQSVPWTEVQDQMVADTLKLTPVQAMWEINKVGPVRTLRAVETRRRDVRRNGVPARKHMGRPGPSASDWPAMGGSYEYRDRQHVRAYREASLAAVRALADSGRRVVASQKASA